MKIDKNAIASEFRGWREHMTKFAPACFFVYEISVFATDANGWGLTVAPVVAMAYLGRNRYNGTRNRLTRRILLLAPRVGTALAVSTQMYHQMHIPAWTVAITTPVVVTLFAPVDVEPPTVDEPVKVEKVSLSRGLNSNSKFMCPPDQQAVYVDAEVTGAISDDFEIVLSDRRTRRLGTLERKGNKFYGTFPVDQIFLFEARRKTILTEQVTIEVNLRPAEPIDNHVIDPD